MLVAVVWLSSVCRACLACLLGILIVVAMLHRHMLGCRFSRVAVPSKYAYETCTWQLPSGPGAHIQKAAGFRASKNIAANLMPFKAVPIVEGSAIKESTLLSSIARRTCACPSRSSIA